MLPPAIAPKERTSFIHVAGDSEDKRHAIIEKMTTTWNMTWLENLKFYIVVFFSMYLRRKTT